MQETPSLRLLYEDEDGLVYVHILDDKYVIHSHIKVDKTREIIQKAQHVSALIDENFKERGITKLYTWSTTDEEARYNQFLGYTPTGMEVIIPGYEGPDILEYSKDL